MDLTRRSFFAAATAGLTHTLLRPMRVAEGKSRPNVVLIMADDLGYECLGCNGGTSYPTPNLDSLAASGTRFTHCYSNPKCVPSRVNILTGRYGFRTGQEWGYIPPDEITFGHVLQDAGYATALAGKWQLGLLKENPHQVHEMGFDEYSCWAWHEGPRYWQPKIWQNGALLDGIDDRYGPEVYTNFLIDFMRRNSEEPFIAYYPMCLPHFAKTGGKYEEPKGPDGTYQDYAEMVSRMDDMVGKLVDALDELGLRENTLIMFTGDNGTPKGVTSQWKGEIIAGGKGTHTDAGTHVPLIASWPGMTPAGAVCDDLIDFSDFMPTLAELAGAEPPQEIPIDGRSFAAQLQGREGDPREWVYTEYEGTGWIRDKRWKLYDDGRFYDLSNDIEENHSLRDDDRSADAESAYKVLQKALYDLRPSLKSKEQ